MREALCLVCLLECALKLSSYPICSLKILEIRIFLFFFSKLEETKITLLLVWSLKSFNEQGKSYQGVRRRTWGSRGSCRAGSWWPCAASSGSSCGNQQVGTCGDRKKNNLASNLAPVFSLFRFQPETQWWALTSDFQVAFVQQILFKH